MLQKPISIFVCSSSGKSLVISSPTPSLPSDSKPPLLNSIRECYVDIRITIRLAYDFELKNETMYGTAATAVVVSNLHQHLSLSILQILRNKTLDGPMIEDIFRTISLGLGFLPQSSLVRNRLSFIALVSSQSSGLTMLAKMAPKPACRYALALAPGALAATKSPRPGWWNSASVARAAAAAPPRRAPRTHAARHTWRALYYSARSRRAAARTSRSSPQQRSGLGPRGAVRGDRTALRGRAKSSRRPGKAFTLSRSSERVRAGRVKLAVEKVPVVSYVAGGFLWVPEPHGYWTICS
ncbi:hypothetical protein AOQ84DRAFT_225381 [Glonium stellatum]|uniref:Uncharacterized protein n=1 Tax=Glonium stellatum TaxID=574774 RepID=A0A8E2JPP3_9PEZI|nr:hypothetical protein AOQ84DRAFT_225381 [Glonium stellatum]